MIDFPFYRSYVKEGYCKQNQENPVYLCMVSPNALGSEITPPCLTLGVNTFRSTEWVLLLLQISCFSHAQLCGTPYMAAHEAPPSMAFSRQEYWLLLLLSCFSHIRPHRWQPIRLSCPWNSPGKNTGVGCHFLLQCMKVKNESEVAQSCPTLSDPMDCSLPGSSVHGIFQAWVLEWGAIAFSKIALEVDNIIPMYKWEKWDKERLSNLPKVIHLIRAGI